MCFEKPLFGGFSKHMWLLRVCGGYIRASHPMQMEGAPGSWIFDRLVTLMRVKDPR